MSAPRLTDLLDALPIPAFAIGRDARILSANALARQVLGAVPEGRHYVTALRQPGILEVIERARAEAARAEGSYSVTTVSSETRYRVVAAPLGGAQDADTLVCLEDVTPLQAAGQMRRDFVANVSHELRTPLTALIGFIETLRGPAREDAPARERFLGLMEREAQRMNRLVGDLLSLGRVEAVERQRPSGRVLLAQVIAASRALLGPVAEEAGVTLEVTLDPDSAEQAVPGDEDQLRQVLDNLIENAIKYGGDGGVVTVELSAPARDASLRTDAVRIVIADRGRGIDALHLPRVTERFYRADSHRARDVGGTGLGLAIVKHIVNRHRGRLEIDSAPGHGTRCTVVLPVS